MTLSDDLAALATIRHSCPACDDDGGICAVCKPVAFQAAREWWASSWKSMAKLQRATNRQLLAELESEKARRVAAQEELSGVRITLPLGTWFKHFCMLCKEPFALPAIVDTRDTSVCPSCVALSRSPQTPPHTEGE